MASLRLEADPVLLVSPSDREGFEGPNLLGQAQSG